MFSSKVICFISVIVILGEVSDITLARPGKIEDEINRIDSEDYPEDYKAVLDIDEEIRDDKVVDDDEIIELVDNDAAEDEDVNIEEIPGIDEEEEDDETEEELVKSGEGSAEEAGILGKRHEDDEVIETEEEVLPGDQEEADAEALEAAWYEKIRQYFSKFGKK